MDLTIQPTPTLSGEIEPYPSKLHTQFAGALALLAGGKSVIERPLRVKDTSVMLHAAEAMGATVKRTQERWSIWGVDGSLKPTKNVIDARNSGTVLSLLTSVATLAPTISVLNGDPQLRSRPMPTLLKALRRLGGDVHSTKLDESPPFVVFGGKLKGGEVHLGELNARYLPALLLPCPYAEERVTLSFERVKNPSQLELALELMDAAGAGVSERRGRLEIPNKTYRAFRFSVPQELSASAPFIVAAALTESKLKIRGVKKIIGRDASFLGVLKMAGVRLGASKRGFYVEGEQGPRATKLDLSPLPELLPIVAVLACKAKGRTFIQNVEEARTMKSDRISAIAQELRRMRAKVLERGDGLVVQGPAEFKGCEVDSHDDYAVTSALAVAGLLAEGKTVIKKGAEALGTSYSRFVSTFQSLGADVRYPS